jgi:hypothetical protein
MSILGANWAPNTSNYIRTSQENSEQVSPSGELFSYDGSIRCLSPLSIGIITSPESPSGGKSCSLPRTYMWHYKQTKYLDAEAIGAGIDMHSTHMWGQAHGSFLIIADGNFMQLLVVPALQLRINLWATSSVHVGMNYSTSTCIALTGVPILVSHFRGWGAPCHLPLRWLVRNSRLRILHRDSKSWRADKCINSESPLRLDCLFYLESCDVTSNGRKKGGMGKICRLRSSIGVAIPTSWIWASLHAHGRASVRPSVRPSSEVRKRKGGGDGSKQIKELRPFLHPGIIRASIHHIMMGMGIWTLWRDTGVP